jgi:membrane-bound inhibitor of C-type lysozyme
MHTRPFLLLLAVTASCGAASYAAADAATASPFQLGPVVTATYRCANGERLEASYGGLKDGSLSFVRLTLPDGQQLTLPQVASGSGARFSADQDVTWWSKGSGGFLQRRDANGNWQVSLDSCEEQS